MSMFTSDAIAATLEVYFKIIKDIFSFQLLASASVSALFDIVRCIPRYCCFKRKTESCCLKSSRVFSLNDRSSVANLVISLCYAHECSVL